MSIHPTAIIDPRAAIDATAEIGPYVVIDGPVRVGARTRVHAHAVLTGWTEIGTDNLVHAHATLGDAPQDLAYDGAESYLRLGNRNTIREYAQIHRGTEAGSATVVGDDNYLMTSAHVGHNCHVGSRVILAGGALLAGHVEVEDDAFVSGNCVVHQFVRVGRLALMRGLSRTSRDVPPFCIMDGTHTVRAINRVGLRRAGFTAAQIRSVQAAFVTLFRRGRNLRMALAEVEATARTPEVQYLIDFIRASKRGVCFGLRQDVRSDDDA